MAAWAWQSLRLNRLIPSGSAYDLLDSDNYDAVAALVEDTPFIVTPYSFLQRRACDICADDPARPHPEIPRDFAITRPEFVRQLGVDDVDLVNGLLGKADLLYRNYGTPTGLLAEGLAFGVIRSGKLVSLATSLALLPKYCDVGCLHLGPLSQPGLRDGLRGSPVRPYPGSGCASLVAYRRQAGGGHLFAEKTHVQEIGTDGREVYLALPIHRDWLNLPFLPQR